MNDRDFRLARGRLTQLVSQVLTTDYEGLVGRYEAWHVAQPGFNSPDDRTAALRNLAVEESWARAALAFKRQCVGAQEAVYLPAPTSNVSNITSAPAYRPASRPWIDSRERAEVADRVEAHRKARARADRLVLYASRILAVSLGVFLLGALVVEQGLHAAGLVVVLLAVACALAAGILAAYVAMPVSWGGLRTGPRPVSPPVDAGQKGGWGL